MMDSAGGMLGAVVDGWFVVLLGAAFGPPAGALGTAAEKPAAARSDVGGGHREVDRVARSGRSVNARGARRVDGVARGTGDRLGEPFGPRGNRLDAHRARLEPKTQLDGGKRGAERTHDARRG